VFHDDLVEATFPIMAQSSGELCEESVLPRLGESFEFLTQLLLFRLQLLLLLADLAQALLQFVNIRFLGQERSCKQPSAAHQQEREQ
jgi:hypothetical protein